MTTAIIIDDDKNTAKLFSEILALQGIDVIGIGYDGADALRLYKNHRPDIVFLDLLMPNVDGFEALKNIKKIDPNAKIVMVTGDLTKGVEEKLQDMGATAIIFKPFKIEKMMSVLDEMNSSDTTITQRD